MREGNQYDIIVIGGGPSGMIAAGVAGQWGARVLLLERMPRLGTKLRITGKGRCNITNARSVDLYRNFLHGDVELGMRSIAQFSNQAIRDLLQAEGVATLVERGDRVYPVSERASDVADALSRYCSRNAVDLKTNKNVEKLEKEGDGWKVVVAEGEVYSSSVVIVACGGQSYPRTGSDGSGYRLAAMIGHSTTALFPSLVGFMINFSWGVRDRFLMKNVGLQLCAEGEVLASESPVDIEICEDWIGGPGVLRLSRSAVEHLRDGKKVYFSLDFKPALSTDRLRARLDRDLRARKGELLRSVSRSWLPGDLVKALLRRARLSGILKVSSLQSSDVEKLCQCLKKFEVQLVASDDWDRAIVTAGGIKSAELDGETLRSRIQEGLYFCGEILDIDGNTGGFNLQLAYSTGFVAGMAAAKEVKQKF